MVEQSIPISMALAAAGGVLNVLATAALAYPNAQREKGANEWSALAQLSALVLNIILQLANSAVNVIASWFGPVSVVLPTILSAQLLFNMVVFGLLIRLEKFSKETRVGTYVLGGLSRSFFANCGTCRARGTGHSSTP